VKASVATTRDTQPASVAVASEPATSRRTDTARTAKAPAKPPAVSTVTRRAQTITQPVTQVPAAATGTPSTPAISTGLPPRDTKSVEVAPAPAPPAGDKARADAAAEAEVTRAREALESYVRAIGAKRIETLQQLFPSMNQQTRDGYDAFFKNVSDLSTQLIGTPTVTLHGTGADAEFVSEMKYRDPSRGNMSRRTTYRAKLQRTDQGWIILSLGAVQ
jgi:hypothetical protein